jgi:hypothetical protein
MALKDFKKSPVGYLISRARLAARLVGLAWSCRKWTRERYTWAQLTTFAFEAAGGVLEPLQVRSEIQRAVEVLEKERARFILEIGTARGGTFFLLSRAAQPDAVLISLDLPGGPWGGGYSTWKLSLYRRLLLPGQSGRFIRANSHSPESLELVKSALGNNRLDVLFIDGDHSYEGVRTDFELYMGLVRPGGLVVFHDIALHAAKHDCHVDRFWQEVRERYPSQEFIENASQGWAGIGLLRMEKREEPSVSVAAH